jgi:hypothetical protein
MYYSYIEIEYIATNFSPARTDLALKLLKVSKAQGARERNEPTGFCGARSRERRRQKEGTVLPQRRGIKIVKPHKSAISRIAQDAFNTGHNKCAAQFLHSRKNVANYLQSSSTAEGYLVAETVCTGRKQVIELPAGVDENASDAADLAVIRTEEVKSVAKRQQKLEEVLKKGFAPMYEQCLQDIKEKLKLTEDWEVALKNQSLHDLIQNLKHICIGFDDHKQEVFNLVQALRALFLYTQSKKETVEEYGHNLKSFWDMVEVF